MVLRVQYINVMQVSADKHRYWLRWRWSLQVVRGINPSGHEGMNGISKQWMSSKDLLY